MVRYVLGQQDLWLIHIINEYWIDARLHPNPTAEQITKADCHACHALRKKAKTAPRYGGLVPPLD